MAIWNIAIETIPGSNSFVPTGTNWDDGNGLVQHYVAALSARAGVTFTATLASGTPATPPTTILQPPASVIAAAQVAVAGGIATVPVAPGAVQNLAAGAVASTSVPLSWSVPATGSAPIAYLVEYRTPSGSGAWQSFASGVTTLGTTVSGLTPSTGYDVRVTPSNPAGAGAASVLTNIQTAAATLSITAQPVVNSVLQRTSTSGGAFGRGAGTVPVAINLSVASVVGYRVRDALAVGNPTLETGTLSGTIAAGASTVQVPVSARLGQMLVDLAPAGGAFVNGTNAFAMGHVAAVAGQSWIGRWMHNYGATGDTGTSLSSLNLLPVPAGCSCFLLFGDNSATAPFTPAWAPPADATLQPGASASATNNAINGAGPAQYMKVMAAALGVSVGVIGFGNGQTAIASWQPGAYSYAQFKAVLAQAGVGFATLIWMQGHSDAQANTGNAVALATAQSNYASALTSFLTQVRTDFPGQGAAMILGTVPDIGTNYWGSTPQIDAIRAAGIQVAGTLANGGSGVLAGVTAVHCTPLDVAITSQDNTHPLMTGSVTLSNHWARAALALLGATTDGDLGPVLAGSGSRPSGSKILTIPITQVGGTGMNPVGTIANQFIVHNAGDPTRPYPVASATVGSTALTLTLAALPADTQGIAVRYRYGADGSGTSAAASELVTATALYDNDTADGFANAAGTVLGRMLRTRTGEIAIAAPGGSTPFAQAPLAMAGSPTYDLSAPKFGSGALSGGYGYLSYGVLPVQGSVTIECWVKLTAAPAASATVAAGGGYLWFGSNNSGNLIYGANGSVTTTTTSLVGSAWQHIALVYNQAANTVTAWVGGTQISSLAVNAFFPQIVTSLGARTLTPTGGYLFTGEIDELAVFNTARYTAAFTPPGAAYVGNESGLLCVYHFDGNGN